MPLCRIKGDCIARMPCSASARQPSKSAGAKATSTTATRSSAVDVSTPSSLALALAASGAIPRLRDPDAASSASLRERPIQSLWAGYGTINELELELLEPEEVEGDDGSATKRKKKNSKKTTKVIVKRVRPPRGDAGDIGHRRKLDSYVCEAAFYRHCARRTIEGGAAIAEPLLVSTADSTAEKSSSDQEKNGPFSLTLVLSDLRPERPNFARGGLRPEQLRASLRWLARFHAIWWGCRGEDEVVGGNNNGLAASAANDDGNDDDDSNDDDALVLPKELADREGTFWHLDTRPEEWEAIPEDGSGGFLSGLKQEARGIADELKEEARKFSTLTHGDAKAANFCWSDASSSSSSGSSISAAAYDFQYVGRGVGARDVAYLLSSAGSSSDEEQLDSSLDFYYDCLQRDLRSLGKDEEAERYTRDVLSKHFRLSTADFVRFMAGWGTWGGGAARAERIAREVVEERLRRRKK